jgi:hypothetical protein
MKQKAVLLALCIQLLAVECFADMHRNITIGNHPSGNKIAITFRIDVTDLKMDTKEAFSIGIRGNVVPLTWNETYPMTDKNKDNIYEATILFYLPVTELKLEYKYLLGTDSWENTGNRVLNSTETKLVLPVVHFNDGPPALPDDLADPKLLYDEIARMDSLLFTAYNSQDVEKMMSYFDPDLEFYHDKGGLTNYAQNEAASREIFSRQQNIRRELVKGSLKVYPVKDYGAMEIGAHQFCHEENGKMDCGTFQFLMIWQKKDGEWKITRVASYDH